MFIPRRNRSLWKFVLAILVLLGAAVGGGLAWNWVSETQLIAPPPSDTAADVAKARDLLAQGNAVEAAQILRPVATRVTDIGVAPEALMVLGRAEQQAGNTAEARKLLERAYREFPSSPDHPRAAIAYARFLEDTGAMDQALPIYQEVRDTAPRDVAAPALAALGRHAERAQDLLKARELFRQAFNDAPWDGEAWNEALDALGRVNVALVFSPMETPESKRYTVQKGDSLTSIGNDLNTTQGLLMRANGIDENTRLNLGQQLKYTPKDFRIVIERSQRRLFLLDKDGIFKCYPVGLGQPGHETTLGSYKVGNKEKNPVWHKPGAGAIPAGDPANELGTRWMPLVPDKEGLPKDLGIHGTIRPETIGKYSSNGCARLSPQDVEELYDLVVRSTPVDIVETFSMDAWGKAEG